MASPSRLPSVRRKPGTSGGSASRPVSMIHDVSLRPPADHKSEAVGLKRRSLLPQCSRDDLREKVLEHGSGGEETVRAAREDALAALEERRDVPPPASVTQSSRLARPTSMRPPAPPSQTARPRSVRLEKGESVADKPTSGNRNSMSSQAGSMASKRAPVVSSSGLQRTASVRTAQSSTPLARSASTQRKPPTHSRNASTASTNNIEVSGKRDSVQRKRPASIDTDQESRPSSGASARSPHTSTNARPSARTQMPPPSRPSFTTYQQHYSPAKSTLPKPPLPPAKPSKPAIPSQNEPAATFETTKQQIELLQLSLLHQASGKVQREYEASAKRKLGKRHAQLCRKFESIKTAETEQTRLGNLEALAAWSGTDTAILLENLQVLGRVYGEVSVLATEGSRYSELVREFESWTDNAEAKLENGNGGVGFVEPLRDEWRDVQASLALKLRTSQRELGTLPPVPRGLEQSSLGVMLGCCHGLVRGMSKEIDVMSAVEREVLAREKRRVDEAVKRTLKGGVDDKKRPWTPAWQKAG